jgi:hypothetical protein
MIESCWFTAFFIKKTKFVKNSVFSQGQGMAEVRAVRFMVLDVREDQVSDTSYIKILTDTHVEWIKLPTSRSKYRYQHQLSATHITDGELVKTRKNWILAKIFSTQEFVHLHGYEEFLKYAEYIHKLSEQLRENQDTHVLGFLEQFFAEQGVNSKTLARLYSETNVQLGY